MTAPRIIPRFKAWVQEIRSQGFDALWERLSEAERNDMAEFAESMEGIFRMEDDSRWQEAVTACEELAEEHPGFADIAVKRAGWIVAEKLNRAIRNYNAGVRSLELRQYEQALRYFHIALSVHPRMERAIYNIGMTHKFMYVAAPARNGSHRFSALDNFRKLIELFGEHPKAQAQIEQLERL